MAAENISKFRAWADDTNMQLNSTARRFSEIEETFEYATKHSPSLLDLLQGVQDLEKECEKLRKNACDSTNTIPEMISNVKFQMEALDKSFALLRLAQ